MRAHTFLLMPITLAALLLPCAPVHGATLLVAPDGTGDYPTIQQAIAEAADGDTVLLTDGIFTGDGNVDVSFLGKDIRVDSQSGHASKCVIDCQAGPGNPHRGFLFHDGESQFAKLANVTIRDGYVGSGVGGGGVSCEGSSPTLIRVVFERCAASSGGGFYAIDGGAPTLHECSFLECEGWNYHGGAAYCRQTAPWFADCYLKGNTCQRKGGALGFFEAQPTVTGCTFIDCATTYDDPYFGGGAIHVDHCPVIAIDGCTFIAGSSPRGGALLMLSSSGIVDHCTFVRHSAMWGSSVFLRNSDPSILRTILAFDLAGTYPVYCAELSDPLIANCCVYGNAGSNTLCGTLSGIIEEDPLFCDLWGDDLTLHENSPCLPQTPYDELIGAHGRGCGWTAVEQRSWGQIKALYRDADRRADGS